MKLVKSNFKSLAFAVFCLLAAPAAPVQELAAGELVPVEPLQSGEAWTGTGGTVDRLEYSGDFRLRYEANSSNGATPSWDRGVLRGRLAAQYELSSSITLGGRLVTGDPDNPRTADATIGDFVRNQDISLDRTYVEYEYKNLFLTGGKFDKPFSSTELLWDGDVNPQGLGGHLDLFSNDVVLARFSGIYFLINERVFEESSKMLGGQLSLSSQPHDDWDLALHAAYYDYDIGVLNPGVPGASRGNRIIPDGLAYISDFDLFDIMGTVSYAGLGDRWNVKFVADYVRNLGADVEEDTGYAVDLFVGSLNDAGSFLFRYGYSQAETDAVLGIFSHDNIPLPTNYALHTVAVDYALTDQVFVGLTLYRFRQLDSQPGTTLSSNSWASRTRLNLYFTF